ncbi:MAG: hypothetical protein ABEJ93_00360 [Candidatus Nanohalobium sp.]
MICVASFIVSAVLGLFFERHREIAKQSFSCLKQRVKTGECEADFETRLKSSIVSKAMKRDKRLARFLNNYMEQISWALIILFAVSAAYMALGIFNFLMFGNCNGAEASGGCILTDLSQTFIVRETVESISFWLPG